MIAMADASGEVGAMREKSRGGAEDYVIL